MFHYFYIVYSISQSKFFRNKIINNLIYFYIQKNRIVLQTTKMGLKIILFVYLLNFTICRNTKLEGAISGPDRTPILQAEIWDRSGRAFHYWSGARQIALSGSHFSRSGPDRRPTNISAWVYVEWWLPVRRGGFERDWNAFKRIRLLKRNWIVLVLMRCYVKKVL